MPPRSIPREEESYIYCTRLSPRPRYQEQMRIDDIYVKRVDAKKPRKHMLLACHLILMGRQRLSAKRAHNFARAMRRDGHGAFDTSHVRPASLPI